MKIAVIGMGAMGCLFSSLLSRFNHVCVFSRNLSLVNHVNRNGIKIIEKNNSISHFFPEAVMNGMSDEKFDLCILMVKSYDTYNALEENRKIIDNSFMLMSLQNGLGNDEILRQFKDENNIIIGTTQHNSSVRNHAEIYHGGDGMTVIGGYSEQNDLLNKVAENFLSCGIDTSLNNDIRYVIWKKLSLNVAVNALTAVFRIPTGRILEPNFRKIWEKLLLETVNVAESYDIHLDYNEIADDIVNLAKRQPDACTSMCKDIENNRKTEIDSINGMIVKLGKSKNIDITQNQRIVQEIYNMR